MADILTSDPVAQYMCNLFALIFSQRVRNVSQKNLRDIAFTSVAALMMDLSDSRRRFLFACIHRIACHRPRLIS